MGRPIGEAGLALIKQFEGCRLTAYKAVSTEKYWTIGWGHYGPDVEEDQTITQAEADRLLESLDQLSGLLSKALEEQGCAPEEVRVTLSTAGGVTADALAEGGVDAAWLPAEDFASCGDRAIAALSQDTGGGVAAVTAAREELDGSFRELLARAVLDTEPGRAFTQLCYPGAAYIPAPEAQSQEADHGE